MISHPDGIISVSAKFHTSSIWFRFVTFMEAVNDVPWRIDAGDIVEPSTPKYLTSNFIPDDFAFTTAPGAFCETVITADKLDQKHYSSLTLSRQLSPDPL